MDFEVTRHVDCAQTTDDLAELISLLRRDPDETVSPWHDLQHLTDLLRAAAYLDLPHAGGPAAIQKVPRHTHAEYRRQPSPWCPELMAIYARPTVYAWVGC